MNVMIKSSNSDIKCSLNKSSTLKYIFIAAIFISALTLLSGCNQTTQLVNSPTPVISYTDAPTSTPSVEAYSAVITETTTSNNASPVYDETYPIPEIIGNTGANIENGGLSTDDTDFIYYIDNGIWMMAKISKNTYQITDMQNISCLNDVGEWIYFLSTHDGGIYRVEKQENSVPEFLSITGASSLAVIGEYMYYCSTVGENSTGYVYKSPLQGIAQECLFLSSTYITPDNAYFYYDNKDDESSLWRYDTISSQSVKISDDKASQINIIDDKIYYISQDNDYNVVTVDRSGQNLAVVVTKGCTDLNIVQSYLIYRTIDTGYIQSYNIKTGETVTLVSYGELFSLSATGSMLFFQSCPADGFEPETYIFDISTSSLNRPLPKKIYAFIKDINLEELTFSYDTVSFFEGDEAIEQYSAYNSTAEQDEINALTTEDGTYYIYNNNEAWIRSMSHEWAKITLIRRVTSLGNSTPYTAKLAELQELFDNNPSLEGKLLFEIIIDDKIAIEINEVYYTIED